MGDPEISVIIPVYNGAKYLEKCLESVFASDYRGFEAIVVDDASTDNSTEIAGRFPCRIINLPENKGVANARNNGADAARGDILIFIDSDIVLEENTISRFVKNHENPNIKICHCQIYPESLTGGFAPNLGAVIWHHYNRLMGESSSFIPTEAFSIDKRVFNEIGRFDTRFKSAGGEEFEIGMAAKRHGYKIYQDQSFSIHHHFQGFWPRWKTLFRRSAVYGRIVFQRNFRLDKGHGTAREGINAALSVIGTLAIGMSVFIKGAFVLFLMTVITEILLDIDLNLFIIKKRGVLFFIKSIPAQFLWYLAMGSGILKAALDHK